MPRGHIETDPSTSSYFVTLSLEYSKGPKSKSMHIIPRGHIETGPSTSSYFVTLSLEYPDWDACSEVRSVVGLFAFRSNQVSKVYQHRSHNGGIFGSSLVDGDFEKEQ